MADIETMSAREVTKYCTPPGNGPSPPRFGEWAGNAVARQLRMINMDSTGLYPKSAKKKTDYYAKNGLPNRYLSLYEVDFNSRYWNKSPLYRSVPVIVLKTHKGEDTEARERIKHMRRLLSDPMAARVRHKKISISLPCVDKISKSPKKYPSSMFMNWKIPSRLVDGVEDIPQSKQEELKQEKSPKPSTAATLPDINKNPASPDKTASPIRSLEKPSSPAKPTSPRKNASREQSVNSYKPASPRKTPPGKRDSLLDDRKREAIRQVIHPSMWQTAENMMHNASSCERRVIEKALLEAARGESYDQVIGKSVLPDAKQTVGKWMQSASESDRNVALKFFTSLGGSQLIGLDSDSKKQRLHDVLEALENGKANGQVKTDVKHDKSKSKSRVFKNIQLVSPSAKLNREDYTTWHHLPQYKTTNVQNTSSHYVDSQKMISRHFTIHPDWGV